ncbi:uncharacterized protein EI90DRAFT_3124553 [Cantharellus anzutake]|uniref:uncharacterized protein n=1 Tax=Cantharellus anzutake TaxID=1750568 RepID=UPI001902EB18|nr:uncharacterized protein EI90DRAFT_3124553 [Cantharellus anzutake]KAF8330138.1 hypothetical protein EI90DRAFT_3124553 [Cantharellus anzutake]
MDSPSPTGLDVSCGSDDEDMISQKEKISEFIKDLVHMADILTKQSELGSSKWAKAITSTPLFTGMAPTIHNYVKAIDLHGACPGRTWPKNALEK